MPWTIRRDVDDDAATICITPDQHELVRILAELSRALGPEGREMLRLFAVQPGDWSDLEARNYFLSLNTTRTEHLTGILTAEVDIDAEAVADNVFDRDLEVSVFSDRLHPETCQQCDRRNAQDGSSLCSHCSRYEEYRFDRDTARTSWAL